MIGSIAGDVIGSVFEYRPNKNKNFPLFAPHSEFTDDTIMTVAIASAILEDGDYLAAVRKFGRRYPNADYGGSFARWIHLADDQPYNSWGNGSAMRVSPVGFAFDSVETVLSEAKKSAAITHNHPEGVKGAQATALAIFLARKGESKTSIKNEIRDRFGYDLDRSLDQIRPSYRYDVSCQGTVPESIIAFLEATDYEDSIRNAISLGGDADTLACITGGIAQAFFREIPQEIISGTRQRLSADLLRIVDEFDKTYPL